MANRWQQNYQLYRRYVKNLALMYQKRQDVRSFIEILLSLTAITIFGLFAIKPTFITIIDLNNQINGKRETVGLLNNKIQALAEAQEIFNQNRANLPLIDIAIPTNPEPEVYIRQIEGLAAKHSLSISNMNTTNVPLLSDGSQNEAENTAQKAEENKTGDFPSNTKSFMFEITASGKFNNIKAFLSDFESLRRAMFVDLISIRIFGSKETSDKIDLSIVGRLVYLPNE